MGESEGGREGRRRGDRRKGEEVRGGDWRGKERAPLPFTQIPGSAPVHILLTVVCSII